MNRNRNNTIGIVGNIAAPVKMIVDSDDWKQRVYETTLTRMRPSGTADTFILQYSAAAAGTETMLEQITEDVAVLVGGEIRTENISDPQPGENRVKIYIYAEIIAVNDPPAGDQNEVKICGHICKQPRSRISRRMNKDGSRMSVANAIIAVNTPSGASYIPCVCFGADAVVMESLNSGDYVEIYGRFLSRGFKKQIPGHALPYLCKAYEICAAKLKAKPRKPESGQKE